MKNQKNTKLNYLYRDAGNYKTHGHVIFSNPDNLSVEKIEKEFRKQLIDSEFFDPDELKIPRLKHEAFSYDPELDHSWNEFDSFKETDEQITMGQNISEFSQDFIFKICIKRTKAYSLPLHPLFPTLHTLILPPYSYLINFGYQI
jgi:hypothetical protein